MFGFHIPTTPAMPSAGMGRLSAGVALVVAILGTALLTVVAAQLAR